MGESLLPFALSPSRASDFRTCPLLFKFRAVDRLPEPPSLPATRGSVVHLALERLFDLPRPERTLDRALVALDGAWNDTLADAELAAGLFGGDSEAEAAARTASTAYVRNYFTLEDPTQLEPVGRELRLRADLGELTVTGILDRLDRHDDGSWSIADYKTGSAPMLERSQTAFFGMQVYAVLIRALFGIVPSRLRLLYLDACEVYVVEPTARDLDSTARLMTALGTTIGTALQRGDFRPRPSKLCGWCAHTALCPAAPAELRPTAAAAVPQDASPAVGEAVAGAVAHSA